MPRAIAYIRVSTDRQAKEGTSLDGQQKRVREYAAAKGYELDRTFVEEGESAKTAKRPTLHQLLAYAKDNKRRLDVVIFPKVDRFARYTEDYFNLKRHLRGYGIRLESTDEQFDDTPAGRFFETMLAATAQFDNDIRSERSRGGQQRAAVDEGRWAFGGRAPLGWRKVRCNGKPTIEHDPITGPVIRGAFDRLARRGFRPTDVRLWMNRKGIGITRSAFNKMVHHKIYIGVIEAFGVVRQGEPPILPLVSETIFRRSKLALRPRALPKTYELDRPDFPLRGTVRCVCGRYLMAGWSRGRSKFYGYYRCKSCPSINLPIQFVERAFLSDLDRLAKRYQPSGLFQKEVLAGWQVETESARQRFAVLEAQIKTTRQLQKTIALKNAQGVLPDTIAREQIDDLAEKLMELEIQQQDCRVSSDDVAKLLDFAQSFLSQTSRYWFDGDLKVRKHLQSFFYPNGATVSVEGISRTAKRHPSTGSKPSRVRQLSLAVPERGLEPPRSCEHQLLKLARLPFRHSG